MTSEISTRSVATVGGICLAFGGQTDSDNLS